MGRYRYISKLEALESDDPKIEVGSIFWMLGKRINNQSIGRLDRETHEFVFHKIKLLDVLTLPKLMKKDEAWAYFDEHIKNEYAT